MTAPLRLRSKRNRVEKVPLPGEENAWAVVKDFGENREGYAAELKMARLLLAAGVFLAGRKLWRDKKNGRTCCGGSGCTCCSGCKKEKKGS